MPYRQNRQNGSVCTYLEGKKSDKTDKKGYACTYNSVVEYT